MKHRTGIISMLALSSFLLCGASSPTTCTSSGHIGPSTGEVVGAAVGISAAVVVGVVVLVEVNKSHHTIKGCVSAGPNGVAVENESDKKSYVLVGDPSKVKVGDVVRLRGTKEKKQKGSSGAQDFVVTNMSRDYGPCKAAPAAAASAAALPEAPKS
jgi:hypothetical protein